MFKLGYRVLMFTLVFTSLSTHSAPSEGRREARSANVEQLAHEIGRSSFSSVFSGLKEQMNVREFERAMAAFQDLRGSSNGSDVTTEEVFRALEKRDEQQAFDFKSILFRALRVCVPSIEENRERARMNAEERQFRKDFSKNYGASCSSSLENILDKRLPHPQTAGVLMTPAAAGAATAN